MRRRCMLFGGLVFVVLAEVAVAAGDGDVARVGGDLLLDELVVLLAAPLEALPGNDEGIVLARVFAGNEGLGGGKMLHDPGQQGPLVHVVETGRELQGPGEVFDDLDVRGLDEFDQEFLVVHDVVVEAAVLLLVELVPFDGAEHRPEHLGAENIGELIGVPLFGEPEEQFAAGAMLADEAHQAVLEGREVVGLDRARGRIRCRAWSSRRSGRAEDVVPDFGPRVPERGMRARRCFGPGICSSTREASSTWAQMSGAVSSPGTTAAPAPGGGRRA
jgi:hypothetical protein